MRNQRMRGPGRGSGTWAVAVQSGARRWRKHAGSQRWGQATRQGHTRASAGKGYGGVRGHKCAYLFKVAQPLRHQMSRCSARAEIHDHWRTGTSSWQQQQQQGRAACKEKHQTTSKVSAPPLHTHLCCCSSAQANLQAGSLVRHERRGRLQGREGEPAQLHCRNVQGPGRDRTQLWPNLVALLGALQRRPLCCRTACVKFGAAGTCDLSLPNMWSNVGSTSNSVLCHCSAVPGLVGPTVHLPLPHGGILEWSPVWVAGMQPCCRLPPCSFVTPGTHEPLVPKHLSIAAPHPPVVEVEVLEVPKHEEHEAAQPARLLLRSPADNVIPDLAGSLHTEQHPHGNAPHKWRSVAAARRRRSTVGAQGGGSTPEQGKH